jgi:hypothetical protein
MIYLLLRLPSGTVNRNREQGRQRKTENQNELLNVVSCAKPVIGTTAGATDRDD